MGIRLFKSKVLRTRPELKRRLRSMVGLAGTATQPGEAGLRVRGTPLDGVRRAWTLEGPDEKESQLYPELFCGLVGPDPLWEIEVSLCHSHGVTKWPVACRHISLPPSIQGFSPCVTSKNTEPLLSTHHTNCLRKSLLFKAGCKWHCDLGQKR